MGFIETEKHPIIEKIKDYDRLDFGSKHILVLITSVWERMTPQDKVEAVSELQKDILNMKTEEFIKDKVPDNMVARHHEIMEIMDRAVEVLKGEVK